MKLFTCILLFLCLIVGPIRAADEVPAGIGVVLKAIGEKVIVARIVPDMPAAAQKELRVGDRVVAVAQGDEAAVPVQNIGEAVRAIRGKRGAIVRLTIIHPEEDASRAREVSFVRGELKPLWGDGVLLAAGTNAPDIEMVRLADGAAEHLAGYTNKTVVLEFWASWCRPCQTSMAALQDFVGRYPDWKSNVVFIAASIDESAAIAARHAQAKGWDKTHNVWVDIHATRAYHIGAIPTMYVIGRDGRVLAINPGNLSEVLGNDIPRIDAVEKGSP